MSADGGGALADEIGVVREMDRYFGVVRTDLLERVLVGVMELGAVGAHQDGTRVDQCQQTVRHVLPAPVVGELEQVDAQLRLVPLCKQLADRDFEVRGIGITGEEQRRAT